MNADDPVSAPVLANRPHHLFWADLRNALKDLREDELLAAEGVLWVRGHVTADAPEWDALISARALLR